MIWAISIFLGMKERVSLRIDKELLVAMKKYAASKRKSVSELVEDYFRSATRRVPRRTILEIMDEQEKPLLYRKADLKQLFYRQQEGKHGF